MANGVVMESETDQQPVSIVITSAGEQGNSSVKCETLHKKYFETVTVTPSPSDNNVDQSNADESQASADTPPTSVQPVAIETTENQDGCHSDKHCNTSSNSSCASKSTSVHDQSYIETSIPVPSSSKDSSPPKSDANDTGSAISTRRASSPIETSFPVQPIVIVEAGKKVEKVCVTVSPPTERIKKKGIKTTPLIKTTLRPIGGKPKSPLVARVAKPAVAIKTTVNLDSKLHVDKSKGKVSSVNKPISDKPKVSDKHRDTNKASDQKDIIVVGDKPKDTKQIEDNPKDVKLVKKVDLDKPEEKVLKTEESDKECDEVSNIEQKSESCSEGCLDSGPEKLLEQVENKNIFNKTKEIVVVDIEYVNDSYKRKSDLSVIDEEVNCSDLKSYLGYYTVRDQLNLDDCETASDSIHVNVDTDSVNTLTDPIDEDFCTQYSVPESEEDLTDSKSRSDDKSKCIGDSPVSDDSITNTEGDILDIDVDIDDPKELECCNVDITNGSDCNVTDLRTELRNAKINEIRAKSASLNRKSHEDRNQLHESGSRLSILRNLNDNIRSFYGKNRSFDSEHSSLASFYSIDNGNCEPNLGSKSRRLKWTPRVLSETRNSSAHSGTFSDCASFYTADTYGTFYSARSFQLDSCDNFQTCEDFQQLDLPPRSKLSKAKEALVRGKDFVKSKFENYRKRLPVLRRSDPSEDHSNSKLCHRTCGFSCVHLGKEISQYSLPDIGSSSKGDNLDNLDVIKGDNCELSNLDYHDGAGAVSMPDLSNGSAAMNGGMENNVESESAGVERVNEIADIKPPQDHDCDESQPTVKMGTVARETTEAEDDDMPVGTEAISIPRDQQISENGEAEDRPANKRLRWVSALEKTQGTSLGSSFTSNSSVEQLLHQREMDPETLLSNLGFGADPHIEDPMGRIPDRFITSPCASQGINLQQFFVSHPELHHLLPVLERTIASTDSSSGSENQPTQPLVKKGSMQRQHTFSGLVQGMKFIREVQAPPPPIPDEEDKQISQIPSVLDFPNRKALARQGFYGDSYLLKKKDNDSETERGTLSRSLSAAQRRKQFHYSCKSKSKNWSLTDESEAENKNGDNVNEETNIQRPNTNLNSFDRGLLLRSFSERFSSDSSLESADSYGDDYRRQLVKQHSISNLRKQYQETLRRSMDGESPVFEDLNSEEAVKTNSISEARRMQVTRLMSSEEDDGDYFANVRQSSFRDAKHSILTKAQNSTQSMTSPGSPNDLKFSFESSLNDGESEFGFSSHPKAPKNSLNRQTTDSNVSVIIEEEVNESRGEYSGEIIEPSNNHSGLEPPALVLRSDSCNTLVSQDTAENEHLEGELTPRPGDHSPRVNSHDEPINKLLHSDDLSESTGSTGTLVTSHDNMDGMSPYLGSDEDEEEPTKGQRSKRSPEVVAKDRLSPGGLGLPQESFELEEISSAEDMNGNTLQQKPSGKRGQMEKSASTHSDSSGFADLDTAGETTQSSLTDIPKETLKSTSVKPKLTKQRTMREGGDHNSVNNMTAGCHDNKTTHDSSSPMATDTIERQIISDQQAIMENMMTPSIEETKSLYVCRRQPSLPENKTGSQENENPELASISYLGSENTKQNNDKSVVYTINVPLVDTLDTKKQAKQPRRFLSKVNLQVITPTDSIDKQSIVSDKSEGSHIVQLGAVQHIELGKCEEDRHKINIDTNPETQEQLSVTPNRQAHGQYTEIPADGLTLNQIHASNHSLQVKSQVRNKQKAKEALVSATSQTADWLLSNSCQSLYPDTRHKYGNRYLQLKYGQPLWASTPDLKKPQVEATSQLRSKTPHMKDTNQSQSLDADPGDENNHGFHDNSHFKGDNYLSVPNTGLPPLRQQRSADAYIDSTRQRLTDRRSSGPAFSDESVDITRYSHVGSSASIPEDHMQFVKLSRLVNGPSLLMSPDTKMPIMRFTPNLRMKNWVDPPEIAQLEEETRLMQYAVHRYKVEMSVMETMLANLCQQAKTEMEPDDRADIEELQYLWNEVKKEVDKMEVLLTERLKSLKAGNDSYSPLDALQIVQAMIDLLREQLYHQQMCINKDVRMQNDDVDDIISNMSVSGLSIRSTSDNSALLSDLSQQVSEVKETVARSQELQKQTLHDTFSELKSSLLSDLKGELSGGSNSKMLQLQLQARDNEIQRLRMELLLQSVDSGKTRKKMTLESDV